MAATVLVRESAVLTADDRRLLDARMTPMLTTPGTGLGRLTRAARGIAYDLDPTAATRRASKAASDRRVSLRPAPDTMTYLTALLPVTQGVAALDRAAKTAAATGDGRGRGQVMADTLVQRATGHDPATPAAADTGAAFVRRLFTSPDRTTLVAMESKQRRFPASLAQLITLRDQTCATPWCDAPIRHIDHIRAHTHGGPTTAANGQGLCAHCNQAKQTPGRMTTGPAGHTTLTTPTGHTYPGTAPPPLGHPTLTEHDAVIEDHLRRLLAAAA